MIHAKPNERISLDYTIANALYLLQVGQDPKASSFNHQQIVDWANEFVEQNLDTFDEDMELFVNIMAEIRHSWHFLVVNKYSVQEVNSRQFPELFFPLEQFRYWESEARNLVLKKT